MDTGAADRREPGSAAPDQRDIRQPGSRRMGACSSCAGRRWRARLCRSNDDADGLCGRDQCPPRRHHRLQGELRWRRSLHRADRPAAEPGGRSRCAAVPHRSGGDASQRQLRRADAAIARGVVGDGAGASADRRVAQLFDRRADLADAAGTGTPGDRRDVERKRGAWLRPDAERGRRGRTAGGNDGAAQRTETAAAQMVFRRRQL